MLTTTIRSSAAATPCCRARPPDGCRVRERVYRHPYRAWLLEFPAGGIEPGEDAITAGAHELAEETGYVAGRVGPLATYEAMPGMMRMRVVLACDLAPGAELSRETLELMDVEMCEDEAWAAARAAGKQLPQPRAEGPRLPRAPGLDQICQRDASLCEHHQQIHASPGRMVGFQPPALEITERKPGQDAC